MDLPEFGVPIGIPILLAGSVVVAFLIIIFVSIIVSFFMEKEMSKQATNQSVVLPNRLEQVAQAIWDANKSDDDTPRWDELSETVDATLKEEIRSMARAAIKACE